MSSPNNWNTGVIAEFRANGGEVSRFAGRPLLLLHTTGARSGQERINPVAFTRDGDNLVVIASNQGRPTNPSWYHNLVANPLVTVEVATETFQAQATVAAEPERTRLFDQMVKERPGFADYQRNTAREIPVVSLRPIKSA